MKVKVEDKIFDAEETPIMIIFNSVKERQGIAQQITEMVDGAMKYCQYPDNKEWTAKKIRAWMRE